MITNKLVKRINELAHKQRNEGLTPDEQKEQAELRSLYLKGIRGQVIDALESSGLKPAKKHDGACECEHCASATRDKKAGKNTGPDKGPGQNELLH